MKVVSRPQLASKPQVVSKTSELLSKLPQSVSEPPEVVSKPQNVEPEPDVEPEIELKPEPPQVRSTPRRTAPALPSISIPKVTLPKVALPKIALPKIAISPRAVFSGIGRIILAPIRLLVAIPLMIVRGVIAALLRLLWIVRQAVVFTLRAATVVLIVGSLVIGLAYVPAVRAALPITKEIRVRVGPWLQEADRQRMRLLAQLQHSIELWGAPPRSSAARRAEPAPRPAASKTGPASRRTTSQVTVAIKSTPSGATVLLDQRRVGKAPLTIKVAPGRHTLTLSHTGYMSETRTINVKAGQPLALDVVLRHPR